MKREAGLWIDHRQAVIVTLLNQGEEIKRIESNIERHVRYSGASHSQSPAGHDDAAEDIRDRRYDDQLNSYYDEVIAALHDIDSIVVFGPGEAKGELRKRLDHHEYSQRIVATAAADKMTDGQIVAEVKQYFRG